MKIINLAQDQNAVNNKRQFALDVLTGLSKMPKSIPSKYFYDDRGSDLFQKITAEQDYYLTSREFLILERMCQELPRAMGAVDEIDIVELGVGDGHKSKLIIDAFLTAKIKVNFYPIDISEQAMLLLQKNLPSSPLLQVEGIVADYFAGLSFVKSLSKNPQLVLFLGSNIGNFDKSEALDFVCSLWRIINHDDHVLIGFDQKKETGVLNRAYNDSSGITAAFNLNLLSRINRELSANFEPELFEHYGFYNPEKGAMESHLISRKDHSVYVGELERHFSFNKFEPIHLEYSFKFLPRDIESLSLQAGFSVVKNFSDAGEYFISSLWRASKGPFLVP